MVKPDYAPEIEFDGDVPLVPNIQPVMILQGSDFEIGYQYSLQMTDIFGPWILEDLKHEFTPQETAALKAYHKQIEDYAPEFIKIFKGRAAGAQAIGIDLSFEEFEFNACRGSSDHAISFTATTVVIPREGNAYIGLAAHPKAPGMHPVMNSKGLAHVHRSPSACNEEPLSDGLPAALHLQHTLRFCDNAEQALAMQLSYPDCQKCSGIWMDASNRQDPHIDDLGSGLFGITQPQDGDSSGGDSSGGDSSSGGGTFDICVGTPSRHAMPLSAGIQYFPINPLHVFVRVTLAESAEAVCSAARTESRYRMYDAYKALGGLTYADAAYVPMKERFEKAIDERQQGEWWLERAQAATGHERVRLYARATRGFVRAQGWASYVYESLVPQPESPSDLGLDEWFGSWGEWESISSIKPE